MTAKTNVVVPNPKNKANWDRLDVGIEYSGRAITLPEDPEKMPTLKAIEALQRKHRDEMQAFDLHEIIDAYPLDAAVAFVRAMQNLYGWASSQGTFFGNPKMMSVKTGWRDEDVVQVPMGRFMLPGIEEPITGEAYDSKFVIHGTFRKKDRHILLALATETRRLVREQSIYRGKAIRLTVDSYGEPDTDKPPTFLNVEDTTEDALIFDKDIEEQINTSILVPIKHTDACRSNKIPLKRGVLLEGPYGTGKSLTARMTANACEKNGFTFILLDDVKGLRTALEFANRYAPAVVFAEDIDRVMSERDDAANDLINTIDGVVSKNAEIMTILTTNFAEKLDPVILRPGRLDAVISLRAPSREAVERLLRSYAGKLLAKDQKVVSAANELAGQIPATIRECVERAKLGMIGRGDTKLSDQDLVTAAQTMKAHLALLNRKTPKESHADKLAASLYAVVAGTPEDGERPSDGSLAVVTQKVRRISAKVDEIHEHHGLN